MDHIKRALKEEIDYAGRRPVIFMWILLVVAISCNIYQVVSHG